MANPSIEELQGSGEFELIAELEHSQIKEFVIDQLSTDNRLARQYMYYQVVMVILGIFLITRSVVLLFRGNSEPLLYSLGGLVFSFSVLIPVHELLHGFSIKLTGARKVNYGAYLRKFIFYAEADRHVLNRKQFSFVALAPLVTVQFLTLLGIILLWYSVWVYSVAMIMSAHSLFCAGDIGLLSVFYTAGKDDIYTFDVKSEKKSYYYQRKTS